MAYWLRALATPAGDPSVAQIQTGTHAHTYTNINK